MTYSKLGAVCAEISSLVLILSQCEPGEAELKEKVQKEIGELLKQIDDRDK